MRVCVAVFTFTRMRAQHAKLIKRTFHFIGTTAALHEWVVCLSARRGEEDPRAARAAKHKVRHKTNGPNTKRE